jgi:DNA repair protein RecN (Recombination protein N)
LLNTLKTKHKGTLAEVIARQREIERELNSFESLEERLRVLQEQREALGQSLALQAHALGEARRAFAPKLCRSIEAELSDLGMPKARLKVEFSPNSSGQGCEVNGQVIGPRGAERAMILISANPGEPLLPVQSAASGGELSRITLAIKRVIADLDPVSVYVFDEMDSGVGGPTAEAVGLKLRHISRTRQVLCITHSPQVAGLGDQHLFVCKQVKGERTRSVVRDLKHEQRVEEISRMLGGARITDRTRANAEELLLNHTP